MEGSDFDAQSGPHRKMILHGASFLSPASIAMIGPNSALTGERKREGAVPPRLAVQTWHNGPVAGTIDGFRRSAA
jgi:hypothetical protein